MYGQTTSAHSYNIFGVGGVCNFTPHDSGDLHVQTRSAVLSTLIFAASTHQDVNHRQGNRLVEQYSKVLLPSKEMLAQLKERTQDGARWQDLETARKRARWEQIKREQDKKREDDKEAERSEIIRVLLDDCLYLTHRYSRFR